jgi:hypothetical protein
MHKKPSMEIIYQNNTILGEGGLINVVYTCIFQRSFGGGRVITSNSLVRFTKQTFPVMTTRKQVINCTAKLNLSFLKGHSHRFSRIVFILYNA